MPGLDALTAGVAQTDQRDARHAVGGLLAVQGPTVLDIRTGVLVGPGSTSLITGTTKTAPKMSVLVGAHVDVGSRGAANGAYLGPTWDQPVEVDVELAPQSGSRLDIVWSRQRDMTSSVPFPDASPGPECGVLTGTSSTGTPEKPDLSAIVGAIELATMQVSAGATSTDGSGVTITPTARQTTTRGGMIPVDSQAERLTLATFPSLRALELDKRRALYFDGAQWRYEGDFVPVANQTERLALDPIYDGLRVKEADTGCVWTYDAATTTWLPFDTKWQTYVPVLSTTAPANAWTLGNGTAVGRFFRKGREVSVADHLAAGSTTAFGAGASGAILVSAPPGYGPASYSATVTTNPLSGSAVVNNTGYAFGHVVVSNSATPSLRRFAFYPGGASPAALTGAVGSAGSWNFWSSGHSLLFSCTYETKFEA